mgnify:CR=1 FL=1
MPVNTNRIEAKKKIQQLIAPRLLKLGAMNRLASELLLDKLTVED